MLAERTTPQLCVLHLYHTRIYSATLRKKESGTTLGDEAWITDPSSYDHSEVAQHRSESRLVSQKQLVNLPDMG